MSVTIRLSRIGRKNQPAYKVVVSNTRDKRNGKYIEVLGYYNPSDPSQPFEYNKEKYEEWTKKGALVSDAVKKLIEGTYEYIKYEPKKVAKKEREESDKPQEQTKETGEEVKEEKPKQEEGNENSSPKEEESK